MDLDREERVGVLGRMAHGKVDLLQGVVVQLLEKNAPRVLWQHWMVLWDVIELLPALILGTVVFTVLGVSICM